MEFLDKTVKNIHENSRETPIVGEYDVVVAGGGIAGCAAAIAAVRLGAKTMLVERYGYLGGIVTAWPVPVLFQYGTEDRPIIKGIGEEIIEKCKRVGRWTPPGEGQKLDQYTGYFYQGDYTEGVIDYEALKLVLMEMLAEEGVDLLLHSWITNVVKEGNQVQGIIVENKSGRQVLLSKVTIDCTGDADVAALAGAEYMLPTGAGGAVDKYGEANANKPFSTFTSFGVIFSGIDKERVCQFEQEKPEEYAALLEEFKKIKGVKGIVKRFGFHTEATESFHSSCNALDASDLTRIEVDSSINIIRSIEFLRERFPGYENIQVERVATQLGVRETRRIVGLYTLSQADADKGFEYDDVICRFNYKNKFLMGIPYRSIVPKEVDGLLIGCRSFSVERSLFNSIRLIGTACGLGHAAGAAAALSCLKNIRPRELEYEELRKTLLLQGAYLDQYTPNPKYRLLGH